MRTYTLALSILVHVLLLAVLVVAPILAQNSLPEPRRAVSFIEEPMSAIAMPPARKRSAVRGTGHVANRDAAPLEPPTRIAPEPAIEFSDAGDLDGVAGGDRSGIVGSTWTGPDDPPPAPEPPKPVAPIHVGGAIREPRKLQHVAPGYPPLALAAGVEGTVILEAEIGEDGRVRNLRVLRSVRLLDEAAVSAVRQWLFTPTLLNGVPVPVVMTVTVAFRLQR